MQSALLAQDPEPGSIEYGDRRLVGPEIAVMLTRARAGQPPVVELVECGAHGRGRRVEHLDESVVIHAGDATVPAMAVRSTTYSTFLGRPGIWLEDVFVRPEHSLGARAVGGWTRYRWLP